MRGRRRIPREFWAEARRGEFQAAEYKRLRGKDNGGCSGSSRATIRFSTSTAGQCTVLKYATDTTAQVLVRIRHNERDARGMIQSVAAGSRGD